MKKVIFSAALLMAAATFSFAGNPKGETKSEAKTEAKTEVKAKDVLFTYYVIARSGTSTYTLSTSPAPQCGSGLNFPCEIESTTAMPVSPSTVPQGDVDSNPNVEIKEWRQSL